VSFYVYPRGISVFRGETRPARVFAFEHIRRKFSFFVPNPRIVAPRIRARKSRKSRFAVVSTVAKLRSPRRSNVVVFIFIPELCVPVLSTVVFRAGYREFCVPEQSLPMALTTSYSVPYAFLDFKTTVSLDERRLVVIFLLQKLFGLA